MQAVIFVTQGEVAMNIAKWLGLSQQENRSRQIELILDDKWDHQIDIQGLVDEIDRWLADVLGYNEIACKKAILYVKPIRTIGEMHGVSALFGFKFDGSDYVELRVRPQGSDQQWSVCMVFDSYAGACGFLAIVKPNYVATCERYVKESDRQLEEEIAALSRKRKHRDVQRFEQRQLVRERLGEQITKFAVMSQVCSYLSDSGEGPYRLESIKAALKSALHQELTVPDFKYLLHILIRNGVLYPENEDGFMPSLHFWELAAADMLVRLKKEREDLNRRLGEVPKRRSTAQAETDRKKVEWEAAKQKVAFVDQDETDMKARLSEIDHELSR